MSDLRIDYADLTGLVDEGKAQHARSRERRSRLRALPLRAARWVVKWAALVTAAAVLPFFVLIRGGVYAYHTWGLGTWLSLGLAVTATLLLLSAYAWVVGRRLGAGPSLSTLLRRGGVAVGIVYVGYTLVYVAGANVKSDEVRSEYRSLHPLLRVAASAVFLADGEAVITDAGRTPEDYWLMGLPLNEASLHFAQDDGFVHALDLRTNGRGELRNRALEIAFWALGFHSLRHVGTADHLHVSLRLPE